MPIYFKGDIAKAAPTITNARLRALLDRKEPRLVRFLVRLWKKQESDVTYAELRDMLRTGQVDAEIMERWRQDYSRFVTRDLMPMWREMIEEAVGPVSQRISGFRFDVSAAEIADYTARHAAELVTNSTAQQIEAIRDLTQRAATVQDMTVDQLVYAIRPVIGLYKGQAVANLNYFNTVRKTLLEQNPSMRPATAEKRARAAAVRYAERQHRYRAHMIARTELSFAHNNGEYHAVRQAQAQGLIGPVKKEWVTADDARVCQRCRHLDGVQVPADVPFPGGDLTPPLHPHCRCVVNYIEV